MHREKLRERHELRFAQAKDVMADRRAERDFRVLVGDFKHLVKLSNAFAQPERHIGG